MITRDEFLDLVVERAVLGLDTERERTVARHAAEYPDLDAASFEHAAAAVHLALVRPEPMPLALRDRLAHDAAGELGSPRRSEIVPATRPRPRRPVWSWAGWLAAAACLALLFTRPQSAHAPRDLAELRAMTDDVDTVEWKPTDDPLATGVDGAVYWSQSLQEGFLDLRGLKPNDPQREQYQLWIIDGEREGAPVDGGVFDVHGNRDLVPIDAKLEVFEPKAFAITLEKPGGVVVSKQERLIVLAAL